MEGYILTTGYSMMGFRRRFCILDGQNLAFYDKLDKEKSIAVGLCDIYFIQDAVITKCNRTGDNWDGKTFCVRIALPAAASGTTAKILIIDCYQSMVANEWYNTLFKAVKSHILEKEKANELNEHLIEMGYPADLVLESVSVKDVRRKYTLKSRECHPDKKGGSVDKFAKLKIAFDNVKNTIEAVHLREAMDIIEYECNVEKLAGVGIGLTIVEDKYRKQLVVEKIDDICPT